MNSSAMSISDLGKMLILAHEGFREKAYLCPAGVVTIGYGHTGTNAQGHELKLGDTVTDAEAIELLWSDIKWAEDAVNAEHMILDQNQFDALVSFVFNVGISAFKHSTLLRRLKAKDFRSAADEFLRWNKVRGKVSAGLTARRKAERDLFLSEV